MKYPETRISISFMRVFAFRVSHRVSVKPGESSSLTQMRSMGQCHPDTHASESGSLMRVPLLWVCSDLAGCQHVLDQADHDFFRFRVGFSYQQSQGSQTDVVDDGITVAQQAAVAGQEVHEQIRTDAFVAVRKWVILDDKVQQVGGLGFHCWVSRLAKDGLVEVAQDGG